MNEKLIGDLFIEAQRQMTGQSTKEFANKFTELIVNECATQCERLGESGDGFTCASTIKELFGIT